MQFPEGLENTPMTYLDRKMKNSFFFIFYEVISINAYSKVFNTGFPQLFLMSYPGSKSSLISAIRLSRISQSKMDFGYLEGLKIPQPFLL